MIRSLFLFLLLAAGLTQAQNIDIEKVKTHISYLASDDLKGRGTSSEGEKMAADYIAKQLKYYGISPLGDSYFFDFTFKKEKNPHAAESDEPTTDDSEKERTGRNVIGFLDNQAEYTIVIGAHFDHLGLGGDHNSLEANSEGMIHNGADDNASGTAGVIELANYFANNNVKEKFNFLFMCFSGEELGLYGSKKWCENPTYDISKINYMVNMDMIGRLKKDGRNLVIYGVGTAPEFVSIIDTLPSDFQIKTDSAGIGPSDQTSFYLKEIPVLHFFTGQHEDYHKPTDDVDKINFEGELDVLNYIISFIETTYNYDKFKYLKTKNPEKGKYAFKVSLGIMPDYTFDGEGLKIDGVTDDKPAQKAGILAGDLLIQLGETPIKGIKDYMGALTKLDKGQTVPVKVKRGKEVKELSVTF